MSKRYIRDETEEKVLRLMDMCWLWRNAGDGSMLR